MNPSPQTLDRCLYGIPISMHCNHSEAAAALMRCFRSHVSPLDSYTDGGVTVTGFIERFDAARVARCVSPTALPRGGGDRLIGRTGDGLFEEAERFWIVNDRWGLCEINLLKSQWHTWLLPIRGDAMRWLPAAVLWPMAQLLRPRGLHLIPAASVARESWIALILSPFEIEGELSALADAGYRIIGRHWVCLRETSAGVTVSHLDGDHAPAPRFGQSTDLRSLAAPDNRVNATIVIDIGRREKLHCAAVGEDGDQTLRGVWPILELHPGRRRTNRICKLLAEQTGVFHMQLARDAADLVPMIDLLRARPSSAPASLPSIFEHATPALQRMAESSRLPKPGIAA